MEPIAKRLKQSAESALLPQTKKKSSSEEEDIAERIKRLEAELDSSSSSSDDDDSSSGSDDDDDDESSSKKSAAVLNLSKYASERIEALPEELLPAKRSSFPMKAEKKKRKLPDGALVTSAHQAIMDLVQMPKKVPFACKRCAFVGKDMADFDAHRQSPEHLVNEQVELRCRLCEKSFTSQAQLDEHKAGKWHQQRAQKKKERHVVRTCYDFMRGSCLRGDRCGFDHAETRAMKTGKALDKKKQRVCDQFAKSGGNCKFGDKCLFSHERS
ncbi:Protein mex-isoform a [Globisporangium polare]